MTIEIQKVINKQYNSNTYILSNEKYEDVCYLIDIGNSDAVIDTLTANQKIKAIFLTHAHYDHICGINEIVEKFPACSIYCSEYTKAALRDSKLNLSFYHKTPISYLGSNIKLIAQGELLNLFDEVNIEVMETPGHNAGSLSFKIDTAIFTGDSLIPEVAIVTKLKSGNKIEAQNSVEKIKINSSIGTTIFPGHGREFQSSEIDWDFYFKKIK